MTNHSQELDELLIQLQSSEQGLSQAEAKQRLEQYGANQIARAKSLSLLSIIFGQFTNPFIYVLAFALVISFLSQHLLDAAIISVTILISTIIGVIQEYKADQSLAALSKIISSKARLIRDGKELILDQSLIVPGDIIVVKAGDKVLADARLIETNNLEVNEAPLTGESLSIDKQAGKSPAETPLAERTNMLYSGSSICGGQGKAIVVATGAQSEIGKIASLLHATKEAQTPLQRQLTDFGKKLSIVLVLLNILIFLIGIWSEKPIYQMFLTSVALVVAAVPEGLMPAMSIILAIGMQKLAKHKGLVRKMLAAETLGSITTICSDKTGTLTTGEMALAHLSPASDQIQNKDILEAACLCNEARLSEEKSKTIGNPTDRALLEAARQQGIDRAVLSKLKPQLAEIPFESSQKLMASLHQDGEQCIAYIKGAPEKILSLSKMDNKELDKFRQECEEITALGYRILALASKSYPRKPEVFDLSQIRELNFLGFIALKDPIRPEAKEAIKLCLQAGIKPIILTGDHKRTAISVARELGFEIKEESVMEGKELEQISSTELRQRVKEIKVFARVEPKHKINIVSALQTNDEIVAMTGDGVNDSPALKKADIGVAVGSGTEITKETADLVLLDDNFMTIVEAIKRGRIIFNNLRKVILCLLIDSSTEMIIVTGSILLALPLPILPAQILWVKLVEDTFPAISLSFEELDEKVMQSKPRKKYEAIINKNYFKLIVAYALIMDFTLLGLFMWLQSNGHSLEHARTIVFVCLGITTLVGVYAIRSIKAHVWQVNPFSNKLLVYATILSMLLYLLAIYTPFFNQILATIPLRLSDWAIILIYSLASIVVYEFCKSKTIMHD
ncbi:MAG: HAD-IC family P-type ATPase [Candidatus Melainabacteria bacterium]|nr:HAD-IC family P-type ATPase [Candidatus Melainabacteria bacterium]